MFYGYWHLQILYILARSATRVGISFCLGLTKILINDVLIAKN